MFGQVHYFVPEWLYLEQQASLENDSNFMNQLQIGFDD